MSGEDGLHGEEVDIANFLLRSWVPLTLEDVDGDDDDDDAHQDEDVEVENGRKHVDNLEFGGLEQLRWGGDDKTNWRGTAEPKSTSHRTALTPAADTALVWEAPNHFRAATAERPCSCAFGGRLSTNDDCGQGFRLRRRERTLSLASYLLLPDWLPLSVWFETEFEPRTASSDAQDGAVTTRAVTASDEWALVWQHLMSMFVQVVRGVEHLHTQGLIHNNVSPCSVWVATDGRCCVGNLSQAAPPGYRRPPSPSGQDATRHRHYASPERRQGRRVGAKSDLYSLGVLMLEFWRNYILSRGLEELCLAGDDGLVERIKSSGATAQPDHGGVPGQLDRDGRPYFSPSNQFRPADAREQREGFIPRWEYRGHTDSVKDVCVTREDSFGRMRFVSTDGKSTASWLELSDGHSKKLASGEHVINAVIFIPPLNVVAAASGNNLLIFDGRTLRMVSTLPTSKKVLLQLEYNHARDEIISGGSDGCFVWRLEAIPCELYAAEVVPFELRFLRGFKGCAHWAGKMVWDEASQVIITIDGMKVKTIEATSDVSAIEDCDGCLVGASGTRDPPEVGLLLVQMKQGLWGLIPEPTTSETCITTLADKGRGIFTLAESYFSGEEEGFEDSDTATQHGNTTSSLFYAWPPLSCVVERYSFHALSRKRRKVICLANSGVLDTYLFGPAKGEASKVQSRKVDLHTSGATATCMCLLPGTPACVVAALDRVIASCRPSDTSSDGHAGGDDRGGGDTGDEKIVRDRRCGGIGARKIMRQFTGEEFDQVVAVGTSHGGILLVETIVNGTTLDFLEGVFASKVFFMGFCSASTEDDIRGSELVSGDRNPAACTKGAERLVCAGYNANGTVTIKGFAVSSLQETFRLHLSDVPTCVRVASRRPVLALGFADGALNAISFQEDRVHDLENGALIGAHTERINTISFSTRLRCMATGSADGYIMIWDLYGQQLHRIHLQSPALAIEFMEVSGDLLVSSSSGMCCIPPSRWCPLKLLVAKERADRRAAAAAASTTNSDGVSRRALGGTPTPASGEGFASTRMAQADGTITSERGVRVHGGESATLHELSSSKRRPQQAGDGCGGASDRDVNRKGIQEFDGNINGKHEALRAARRSREHAGDTSRDEEEPSAPNDEHEFPPPTAVAGVRDGAELPATSRFKSHLAPREAGGRDPGDRRKFSILDRMKAKLSRMPTSPPPPTPRTTKCPTGTPAQGTYAGGRSGASSPALAQVPDTLRFLVPGSLPCAKILERDAAALNPEAGPSVPLSSTPRQRCTGSLEDGVFGVGKPIVLKQARASRFPRNASCFSSGLQTTAAPSISEKGGCTAAAANSAAGSAAAGEFDPSCTIPGFAVSGYVIPESVAQRQPAKPEREMHTKNAGIDRRLCNGPGNETSPTTESADWNRHPLFDDLSSDRSIRVPVVPTCRPPSWEEPSDGSAGSNRVALSSVARKGYHRLRPRAATPASAVFSENRRIAPGWTPPTFTGGSGAGTAAAVAAKDVHNVMPTITIPRATGKPCLVADLVGMVSQSLPSPSPPATCGRAFRVISPLSWTADDGIGRAEVR
eukprot:g2797.t1